VSSQSYTARISRKVKDQIAGWRLPREVLISVYAHLLTELPAHPDRHLHEPITRPNLWAYHFTLGEAPARRFFTFAVERRDYVGELHVLSGQMVLETPSGE
jgi:hypothetical protein